MTEKTKKSNSKSKQKNNLKINKNDENYFPYEQFPVKVIHMDNLNQKDKKTCYFTSEVYAKKYIKKNKFKKVDYKYFVKK